MFHCPYDLLLHESKIENPKQKQRFKEILFLLEWKYAIDYGRQLLGLKWFKNGTTCFHVGSNISNKTLKESFTLDEAIWLEETLSQLGEKTDFDLSHLLVSTYPFIVTNSGSPFLDLVTLMKDYKKFLASTKKPQ